MAKRKFFSKFIISIVVTLIIGLFIVSAAAFTMLNMPLKKFTKTANAPAFYGNSINSLGLGDVKLKDFLAYLNDLKNTDEDDLITNPYDTETEAEKTEDIFNKSLNSLDFTTENGYDYLKLFENGLNYDLEYMFTLDDTTIAYIINDAIKSEKATDSSVKGLSTLHSFAAEDAAISEFTITKNEDGTATIRTVFKLDANKIVGPMASNKFVRLFVSMPDSIFLVSELTASSIEDGENAGSLSFTHKSFSLNGEDGQIANGLLKILSSGSGFDSPEDVNNSLAEGYLKLFNNIGKLGVGEADENGIITDSTTIEYGNVGLEDGKINLLVNIDLP